MKIRKYFDDLLIKKSDTCGLNGLKFGYLFQLTEPQPSSCRLMDDM